MEAKIAADAPLDYVTFQIFPENRYDACVRSNEKEEIIGRGPLDQLLEHLPNIRDQAAKESCDSFKIKLPVNVNRNEWFTKATLTRFLHIICSPDSLNKSVAISKEMSQLEETRKFHLSLYAKAEDGIISSDNSKNELLRAMDSRLAALMEELVSTFNMAAGATFSCQEMIDLQKFCQHFGDEDIRNLVSKVLETSQKGETVTPMDNKKSHVPLMTVTPMDNKKSHVPLISKNDVNKTGRNVQIPGSLNSVKPVIYNASPAKAAEVERQSLTESDDSSFSTDDDDDDQAPVERSRTLIRSASPRRSASPMRRIQIGRSGPRRTPALTIKNFTCFPARERVSSHGDMGNDGKLESSEEPNKNTEVNVTRISVQDAISLFESKQKDQATDAQKRSFVESSTNANKSVLRRWSSGMGESQKSLAQNISENAASDNNSDVVDEDIKPDMNPGSENPESKETVEVNMESETSEKTELHPIEDDDVPVSQPEKINEKMDSVEWSRQKEEELSQMLMKFAEYRNSEPDNGKKKNPSLKQRVGFNGQNLRVENDGKRAQSEFRAKQKVLEEPKPEKSSMKVSEVGKKRATSRSSILNKNSPPVSSIPKKESPKPAMPKKAPSKSSPLPTTRKSWPSTTPPPPPRATGALPKIPTGTRSPRPMASRQKPQSPALHQKPKSPAPLSRPSPKLERPQMQSKDVKAAQVESKKSLKRVDDSKNRVLPRSVNRTKTKTKTGMASEEDVGTTPAKAVVRKKVTKKSSVVPLGAKPSTGKVSRTSPVKKVEIPTQVEETSTKFEDPLNIQEGVGEPISDTVDSEEPKEEPISDTVDPVSVAQNSLLEIEEPKEKYGSEEESSNETSIQGDETAEKMSLSPEEIQPVQEPLISPAAWEERSHHDPPMPAGNSSAPSPLNHDMVAASGTRVRHSLSQMLLEESSEPDITEWGNAENPPTMVYQKDAPKGLKRLLKFARKNKGEANGTAWASPYTSEGEDDGDETKSLGKRHSDNLLRKVALHSKNYGEGFLSDSEPLSARSYASNSSARSSNKFQEGHTTSKGARSFFSLSAFRGNKN